MRLIRLLVLATAVAPSLALGQAGERIAAPPTGGASMPAKDDAEKITMKASMVHGELLLDIGPFDLAAEMKMGPGDDHEMKMPEAPPLWAVVPASGWLHGYRVELVDKDGHTLSQKLLHHVNVIATQRRELFSGIMLRVAAAGPETGAVSIPSLIGYEAHAGDTLLVRTMLHPDDQPHEGVHVLVHFPFTSLKAFISDFTISPFYMDVTPPAGGHAFDIPPGHSEWFWEAKPAIPGRIIGFSGHVHRYATLFKFEDRTANKIIWQVRPDTTADGEPKQIPVKKFLMTLGYAIRTDHVYRLTVVYDNPTGATVVDGGMGALGGVFKPSAPWPSIDPNDKDYRLDVWAMWRP